MPEKPICPVCDKPLIHISSVRDRDCYYVTCDLCGEYETSGEVCKYLKGNSHEGKKYVLSGVLRNAYRNGKKMLVLMTNYKSIIDSANLPKNPFETIERILLYIFYKMDYKSIIETISISIEKDFPIFYLRSGAELDSYLIEMKRLDFISGDNGHLKITLNGWKKVDEINKYKPDSDQAFIAMSFHESLKSVYDNGIMPALEETGFHPYRVDTDQTVIKIDDAIIAEIRRSGLLIVDCTGNRPAVYFEAGFAIGLGIPVIWTCREDCVKDLCFDTRQYNHLIWKNESEFKEKLTSRIAANFPTHIKR